MAFMEIKPATFLVGEKGFDLASYLTVMKKGD